MDKNTEIKEEKVLRQQLIDTQQVLKEREGQFEKSLNYIGELEQRVEKLSSGQNNIEELQRQNEKLSQELHVYRNAAQHHQDTECQVGENKVEQLPETPIDYKGEIQLLQQHVEKLNSELYLYRSAAQHRKDAGCQVGEDQMLERQLEKSQRYNEDLRQQIEKLSSELHSYRSAAQHRLEAECQVGEKDIAEAYGDKPFPVWDIPDESAQTVEGQTEDGISIADSLTAAAQKVVWEQAGYVYDSASGLYYDSNTGFYYDTTSGLTYDPSTQAYYYYDQTEEQYKFHSYTYRQHGEQGSVETDTSQNKATTSEQTENMCNHSDSGGESRRNRHREKRKVQKGKILKARRRTKSSKHKSRTKVGKIKDSSKDETVSASENGISLVRDCDEEAKKDKQGEDNDCNGDVAMEVDSSDSIATGESEMKSEPESGELTESSSSSSEDVDLCGDPVRYDPSAQTETKSESSVNVLPCIRIIIQASESVAVGTFFLVTCSGGTIGRDKDPKHAVQIPDVNVSKVHAEIKYDYDNSCYTVEDMGSQNGTFINDLRISESKEKSAAVPLSHGDTLQVASTQMLLHIHPGTDTCDLCEPGQVMAALQAQQTVFNDHVVLTSREKKQLAKQELKVIKKKYGLANSAYVDNMAAIKNPDYADKSELRRRYLGSEHPSHVQRQEEPASVYRPISSENKGHRMLAKMGWKEGSGLGKEKSGIVEPVTVELRANQAAGLGSTYSAGVSLDNVHSANKMQRFLKTKERYHRTNTNFCSQSCANEDATSPQ